jgi:hypothetical protein
LNARELAPRARFELATLRLTAEMIENLSALSGVAHEKLGAIFLSLVAPTPAPTAITFEWVVIGAQSGSLRWPVHLASSNGTPGPEQFSSAPSSARNRLQAPNGASNVPQRDFGERSPTLERHRETLLPRTSPPHRRGFV